MIVKEKTPLTAGNARYLAQRLGSEHASSNRTVFNIIARELFEGYAECIRQPIDNNWRRMPTAPELCKAAEEGYLSARRVRDEHQLSRLKAYVTNQLRSVLHAAAPKLVDLFDDPSVILTQRMVTELMEIRFRTIRDMNRENSSLVRSILVGRKSERLHTNFLAEFDSADLMRASIKVATKLAYEVSRYPDNEYLGEMVNDAKSLLLEFSESTGDAILRLELEKAEHALDETGLVSLPAPTPQPATAAPGF